jgi:hypothetical protein
MDGIAPAIRARSTLKRRLAAYQASFGTTPVSAVTVNLRFAPILGLFLKTARFIHGHGHGAMRHLQRWQDQATQLSQLTAAQLALKHQPAEFALKPADCSRQGGLGNMARPRGLGEVALSRDSKKISDLMQLHRDSPTTNVRFDIHQLAKTPSNSSWAVSVLLALRDTQDHAQAASLVDAVCSGTSSGLRGNRYGPAQPGRAR